MELLPLRLTVFLPRYLRGRRYVTVMPGGKDLPPFKGTLRLAGIADTLGRFYLPYPLLDVFYHKRVLTHMKYV